MNRVETDAKPMVTKISTSVTNNNNLTVQQDRRKSSIVKDGKICNF